MRLYYKFKFRSQKQHADKSHQLVLVNNNERVQVFLPETRSWPAAIQPIARFCAVTFEMEE